MQTQEITESPFHSKLISAEKVQRCLKEGKKYVSEQAHFHRKMLHYRGSEKNLALNCKFQIYNLELL